MYERYPDADGDEIVRVFEGGTDGQATVRKGVGKYRVLVVSAVDGEVANDGTDTETVTVEVVDGLEVVRGSDPSDASVLDYSGDVTLTVDGVETAKTLSNGSVSFDLTTTKPEGSTIEIVAESLADHRAEIDRTEIEVLQA